MYNGRQSTQSQTCLSSLVLVRIRTVLVVLVTFAPTHPSGRCLQNTLARIDDRTSIHFLASHLITDLVHCVVDARDMRVNVDAFPVAGRHMICLVENAEMWVLLHFFVPPVPSFAMIVGMGEFMQSFYGFEVANFHDLVARCPVGGIDPTCDTEEAKLICVLLEIFDHVDEVTAELLSTRSEETQGMVCSGADEEDNYVGVRRFVAVLALLIWEHSGVFLRDDIVHVFVVFPSDGLCISVE